MPTLAPLVASSAGLAAISLIVVVVVVLASILVFAFGARGIRWAQDSHPRLWKGLGLFFTVGVLINVVIRILR